MRYPAEGLEIVLADKTHEQPDHQHGNEERNNHTGEENQQLVGVVKPRP